MSSILVIYVCQLLTLLYTIIHVFCLLNYALYPVITLYCGLILLVYVRFLAFYLYMCIVLSYFIFYGLLSEITLDDDGGGG